MHFYLSRLEHTRHKSSLWALQFQFKPAKKEFLLCKLGDLIIFVFYKKIDLLVKNSSLFNKPISFSIKEN